MTKAEKRDIIVWIAAIVAFVTGVGLTIGGFFVPPTGEISGSVLTALGEFLTFFGSVFGIAKFTNIQLEKLRNADKEKCD